MADGDVNMELLIRDLDMEFLIKEIHSRPVLWNTKDENYANKDLSDKAWNELCTAVDDHYDKRSPEQQMKVCQTIKRKYKSLRDSYQRERNLQKYEDKIGQKNPKRKKYLYFDKLHFLSTGITRSRRVLKKTSRINVPKKAGAPTNRKTEKVVEEPAVPKQIAKQIVEEEEPYLTIKLSRTPPPQLLPLPSSSYSDLKNNEEDTLFLLSLVKEIKKIPEDNRLPAKIDILQTIRRWQASTESQHNNLTFVQLNQNQIGVSKERDGSSCRQKNAYDCSICHRMFRTKDYQRNHLKTHIKNGFYTCSICSIEYITMNELVLHMKTHKKLQSVVPETSNVVDHSALIKNESVDDTLNGFDDPEEIDIVKFELSDSDESKVK